MAEFLECCDQVRQRSAPPVQSPDQDYIDFAAARSLQQLLPQLSLRSLGTDFFDLHGDSPPPLGRVLAHRAALHWWRLLIPCGNTDVHANMERCFGPAEGVAKNPTRIGFAEGLFSGRLRVTLPGGRNLHLLEAGYLRQCAYRGGPAQSRQAGCPGPMATASTLQE